MAPIQTEIAPEPAKSTAPTEPKFSPAERLVPAPDLRPAMPASSSKARALIYALISGLVVGLFVGAILLRAAIMEAMPGSAALYALLGLEPESPASQLEIANLRNEEQRLDGQRLMDISGVVFNPGEKPLPLPPIVIAFTDASGKLVDKANVFHFKQAQIEPGENVSFKAEKVLMPDGAKSYRVGFGATETLSH